MMALAERVASFFCMVCMMLVVVAVLLVVWLWWCAKGVRRPDPVVVEALNTLQRRVHVLMRHLQKNHPNDPRTQRLIYRWDGKLLESEMLQGAGATTNKQTISICMKSPSGALEDPATGFFVAAHEVSHVVTESQGHTDEFWENFRFVLKEAVAAGVYEYQDFEKTNVKYCGSTISHSPLSCLRDGTC